MGDKYTFPGVNPSQSAMLSVSDAPWEKKITGTYLLKEVGALTPDVLPAW